MDGQTLKEEQLKLEKKLFKEPGGKDRVKELRAMCDRADIVSLDYQLKELAKHRQAILSQRKSDEHLKAAKNHVSNLNAPYQDQLKGNDTKSRYIGLLLQEINDFEDENYANEED